MSYYPISAKQWYQKNKLKKGEQVEAYYLANKEQIAKNAKIRYAKNREAILEYARQAYKKWNLVIHLGAKRYMEQSEYTAKDIMEMLLETRSVVIPHIETNSPEIARLLNHLNVMKSKSKKIYTDLGLDWENVKIEVSKYSPSNTRESRGVILTLVAPRKLKKFVAFTIITPEKKDASN